MSPCVEAPYAQVAFQSVVPADFATTALGDLLTDYNKNTTLFTGEFTFP